MKPEALRLRTKFTARNRRGKTAFVTILWFFKVACCTGLMGCWKASGDHLISTATLMLLASLCGAAGMGFWHGAHFYEMEKVSQPHAFSHKNVSGKKVLN